MKKNNTYPFSDELSGDHNKKINIQDAVNLNIICEDGIQRRVVEIVFSKQFPWRAIINENDPESQSGYFVNLLSLMAQLINKPLPNKEQEEAFIRSARARYKITAEGFYDASSPALTQSPIILPPGFHRN